MFGFLRKKEKISSYRSKDERDERLKRAEMTLARLREVIRDADKLLEPQEDEKETRE